MAALLIMISLLSIGMIALLPVWRQQSQREKEAELAFRGEQYARAIYLFRTKNGNQPPPNIDVLVQGKYLRKKYKDPITGDDFQPIFGGQQPQPGAPGRGGAQLPGGATPGSGAGPGRGGPRQGPSGGVQTSTGSVQGRSGGPTPTSVGSGSSDRMNPVAIPDRFGTGQGVGGAQGGMGLVTVQSKSKEASIRIYNNASHYNQWQFLYNARGRGGLAGDGGRAGQPGIGGSGGRGVPGGPGSGTGGGRGPGAAGRGRGFGPGGGRG